MNAETLKKMLTDQPFKPFEVHMTNGEVHSVRHPEMAWVVGGKVYVHIPEKNHEVLCSLLRIASVHPVELARK